LGVSGLVSAGTAVWAYRAGRRTSLASLWNEDGLKAVGWLVGWIGFVYGVQLSLLVLALLRVLAGYDFLQHPDGPAMMAIIIACTSVARDAFEIGHVRALQRQGHPVLTFPDGAALRTLLLMQPGPLLWWSVAAAVVSSSLSAGIAQLGEAGRSELGQFIAVSVIAGTATLFAYLAGEQRSGGWSARLAGIGWWKLFQFWWWPGLAFAATYYLVFSGIVTFLLRLDAAGWMVQGLMAGVAGGLMSLYGYYLGHRRHEENRVTQAIPSSLLRCPFVAGILSKVSGRPSEKPLSPPDFLVGESGRRR
jgi:hypothetical protein